jgi:hypothetical protein
MCNIGTNQNKESLWVHFIRVTRTLFWSKNTQITSKDTHVLSTTV